MGATVSVECDLRDLFPASGDTGALESFLGARLFETGIWESPRACDGIEHLRVVRNDPRFVSLSGRIFTIDQILHSFWLDLEARDACVAWSLHLDVVASSSRRARHAADACDHAADLQWRVSLAGRAEVREGRLVPVGPWQRAPDHE